MRVKQICQSLVLVLHVSDDILLMVDFVKKSSTVCLQLLIHAIDTIKLLSSLVEDVLGELVGSDLVLICLTHFIESY